MGNQEERPNGYRCVECGQPAPELYKEYPSKIIKVSYCEKCGSMVDQYITFDSVIVFLDALLLKAQAYRHLLFNVSMTAPWKLLLIFMLCDSYLKWDNLHGNNHDVTGTDKHVLYAALEWDFYRMFLLASTEWLGFVGVVLLGAWLLGYMKPGLPRARNVHRALILSSFGKLLAVPAIIWGQTHSALYLLLAQLFVFTSNVSAVRVVTEGNKLAVVFVLGVATVSQYACGRAARDHFGGS